MLYLMFSLFMILFILFMMMMMNFILSKKMFKDREKMSPFECGFDPLSKSRLPFSLQFYLISIIFLIFDVEIALILPFIYLNSFYYFFMYFNMVMVLVILLFGLFYEWFDGALKWFK